MMYSKFAKYYDRLGWDIYTQAWHKKALPIIEKIRQSFNIAKPDFKIIDLACGAGELCLHFRKDKYSTCGLDISKEMLIIAKRKNPTLKFYNKNLINFSIKKCKSAVINSSFFFYMIFSSSNIKKKIVDR